MIQESVRSGWYLLAKAIKWKPKLFDVHLEMHILIYFFENRTVVIIEYFTCYNEVECVSISCFFNTFGQYANKCIVTTKDFIF